MIFFKQEYIPVSVYIFDVKHILEHRDLGGKFSNVLLNCSINYNKYHKEFIIYYKFLFNHCNLRNMNKMTSITWILIII